jgi:hypothetical protein
MSAGEYAHKPIPQKGKTRVFYKFNGPEQEIEFICWTLVYLVVKYPASGKPWRMGRKLVNQWLESGVLRIEGEIPELALVV